MSGVPISALYAGLFGLRALLLANNVLRVQRACPNSLLLCRVLHAWGLGSYAGPNYPRLIGAQGTFLLMSIMGVALIYSALR